VHMQDMSCPEEVSAVLESDAGKVFYHRESAGEVIHIDIFHSPGCLDPKVVAQSVVGTLSGIEFEIAPGHYRSTMETFLPYIDVQTAGGGGRINGELCYGQEQGARAAHQTHVHLTALWAPEVVASLFSLIAAVECAIESSGLELRKVKRVRAVRGNSSVDMSAYQTTTDSLLKQMPQAGKESGAGSAFRQEAMARRLAEDLGSAEDAKRLLECLAKGMKSGEFSRFRPGSDRTSDEVRQALSRSSLWRFDGHKYSLTKDGEDVLSFVSAHMREIESYLRRLLWSLPRSKMPQGERKGHKTEPAHSRGRGLALPRRAGEPLGDLAVPETVIAACARSSGATTSVTAASIVSESDLRFAHSR